MKYIVTEPALTSLVTNQIVTIEELAQLKNEFDFENVQVSTICEQEEFFAITLIKNL